MHANSSLIYFCRYRYIDIRTGKHPYNSSREYNTINFTDSFIKPSRDCEKTPEAISQKAFPNNNSVSQNAASQNTFEYVFTLMYIISRTGQSKVLLAASYKQDCVKSKAKCLAHTKPDEIQTCDNFFIHSDMIATMSGPTSSDQLKLMLDFESATSRTCTNISFSMNEKIITSQINSYNYKHEQCLDNTQNSVASSFANYEKQSNRQMTNSLNGQINHTIGILPNISDQEMEKTQRIHNNNRNEVKMDVIKTEDKSNGKKAEEKISNTQSMNVTYIIEDELNDEKISEKKENWKKTNEKNRNTKEGNKDKVNEKERNGDKIIKKKFKENKVNKNEMDGEIFNDETKTKRRNDEHIMENRFNKEPTSKLESTSEQTNEKQVHTAKTNEEHLTDDRKTNEEKEKDKKLNQEKIVHEKLSGKNVKQQKFIELEINETIDIKKISEKNMVDDKKNDEENNYVGGNDKKIKKEEIKEEIMNELAEIVEERNKKRTIKEETNGQNFQENKLNEETKVSIENTIEVKATENIQNDLQSQKENAYKTGEKIKDETNIATTEDNEAIKNKQAISDRKRYEQKVNEIDVKKIYEGNIVVNKRNEDKINYQRENEFEINEDETNENINNLRGFEEKLNEERTNKEKTNENINKESKLNEEIKLSKEKFNEGTQTKQKTNEEKKNVEKNKEKKMNDEEKHNVPQISDDVADLPPNWSKSSKSPVRTISLDQDKEEFSNVASTFFLTMNNTTVKIIRVKWCYLIFTSRALRNY